VWSGNLDRLEYSTIQVLEQTPASSYRPYQPPLTGFWHERQSPTTVSWYCSCTSRKLFPFNLLLLRVEGMTIGTVSSAVNLVTGFSNVRPSTTLGTVHRYSFPKVVIYKRSAGVGRGF